MTLVSVISKKASYYHTVRFCLLNMESRTINKEKPFILVKKAVSVNTCNSKMLSFWFIETHLLCNF